MFSTTLIALASTLAFAGDTPLSLGGELDCDTDGIVDTCQALTLDCTTFGTHAWIEYRAGTLPIILSVPHGGSIRADEVPERTSGTTGSDMRTIETAEEIADALYEKTGRRPHLIISNLHRSRLDPNRELSDAHEGSALGEQAWSEYHNAIRAAHEAVMASYGGGLYVDIHGLNASRTRNEFSYLLDGDDLLESDAITGHPAFGLRSSVATMAAWAPDFMEIIRGESGLGGLMDDKGYEVVPSPSHPDPGVDDHGHQNHYFNGGYSTRQHGSYYGGTIDGIQIEHMWEGVRDTADNRAQWGKDLAEALITFTGTYAMPTDLFPVDLFPMDMPFHTCPMFEMPTTEAYLFDDWGTVPFESLDDLGPLFFDGEDDIVVAHDRDLGDSFSVALSFRAPEYTGSTGRYQYLYSHGTYSWRNSVAVFFSPWGKLGTNVRGADESHSYSDLNGFDNLMDGAAHTYVLTVDSTSDEPVSRVYVDGELVKEATRGKGGVAPQTPIHIGGREDLSTARFFEGEIADVQLFDRALTADEVATVPVFTL